MKKHLVWIVVVLAMVSCDKPSVIDPVKVESVSISPTTLVTDGVKNSLK
jgi:hypothetical protein